MFCYVHIPFCESKCKYCRFASIGGLNTILTQKYITHLIKDIEGFSKCSEELSSIYFGGGTPSILNQQQLQNIINTLKIRFGLKNDIEISLETTPQNLIRENIIGREKIGINRLSIGVQSLNNKTLNEIGRANNDIIFSGLEALRHSQIKNISVDFIIGLPFVNKGEVKENIDFLLKKYPFITHISVYMLEDYYEPDTGGSNFDKIKYPTPWQNLGLDESEYQAEYKEIYEYLKTLGFSSYEISNFAREGYTCKHNQSYWNHENIVGFGLGSHSYINGERYAYVDDFIGYYAGKKEYKEILGEKEIFLEKVMFGMRTSGLKKEIYQKLNQEKIDNFVKNGILFFENKILKIDLSHRALLDTIILEIIS